MYVYVAETNYGKEKEYGNGEESNKTENNNYRNVWKLQSKAELYCDIHPYAGLYFDLTFYVDPHTNL